MSVTTPVIGPVSTRVAGPVNDPPGKGGKGGGSGGRSEFEISISALEPIAWYRFRDGNFNNRIQDKVPGGNKHLVKQIAAATRSAVPTRTTHPGGALFPSVAYDDWANDGTFYKRAAESLLSGATEYTALISFRMIKAPSNTFQKAFGLGIENVAETGDNDLAFFKASANSPTLVHYWKNRYSGALIPANFEVTEKLEDGVNRLATVRFDSGTLFRLMTSKPGHEGLVEDTAGNSGPLKALSRALILNARSETNTGSSTTLEMVVDQIALFDTDIGATAEADLHSKWMDEVAGAGYYPSMMQFDGSTGYYSDTTLTVSGNKVTGILRFNREAFSGGGFETLCAVRAGASNFSRMIIRVFSSDHATTDQRSKLLAVSVDGSNNALCRLISTTSLCDGEDHVLHYSFDGDNGTAVFRVDEVDEDNASATNRVAPTSGTLPSGGTPSFAVGGGSTAGIELFSGQLGFVGHADAYLTNYADFMDGNLPKPIDEKDWTEWGAQPLFWSHTGQMDNSKGSAGDMTENGTITMTTGGSP